MISVRRLLLVSIKVNTLNMFIVKLNNWISKTAQRYRVVSINISTMCKYNKILQI